MVLSMKRGWRLGVAAATLTAAAGASVAMAGSASAASTCAPTDYSQDGHVLTAAFINPTALTGPVDATGCDIGVYFNEPGSLNGVTIGEPAPSAPRYYGVLVNGAAVDITDATIDNVGDQPHTGAQHGVGVRYVNGASGTLSDSSISNYQKNGVVVSGNGTSANITDNSVTGSGRVAYIAQNGIQFSDGATGSATGNDVSDNYFTGCSNKDAAKTGCIPYVSTGILLYGIDPPSVNVAKNHYRDNQRNHYMAPANSLG